MTLMGFRGWVLGAKLDCQKQNQRVKEVTIRMFVKMEIDGSMINWMINSKSKALHLFQTLAVQTWTWLKWSTSQGWHLSATHLWLVQCPNIYWGFNGSCPKMMAEKPPHENCNFPPHLSCSFVGLSGNIPHSIPFASPFFLWTFWIGFPWKISLPSGKLSGKLT